MPIITIQDDSCHLLVSIIIVAIVVSGTRWSCIFFSVITEPAVYTFGDNETADQCPDLNEMSDEPGFLSLKTVVSKDVVEATLGFLKQVSSE